MPITNPAANALSEEISNPTPEPVALIIGATTKAAKNP
jgi:hypothetical protein